ncbi:single-stranded DNA-binding protein [Pseudactinotalea sp. HY158]|nr:single-stranded DNA-binding protein [Pseudactinotalea sp. HY158]
MAPSDSPNLMGEQIMSNEVTVTIRGHAGERAELRTGGQKPFVRLSVATTPRRRSGEEWVDGPTQWYQVKAWGDFAENIAASVERGDAVVVTGPLRIEEYTTDEGVTHKSAVILANAFGMDLRRARARATKVRPVRPGDPDAQGSPAGGESANAGDVAAGDPAGAEAHDVSGKWATVAAGLADETREEDHVPA